jgi:hypothetical protein
VRLRSAWLLKKRGLLCMSDAEGGLILPGFQDAHVHPLSGMIIEQSCDLAHCSGIDSALALVPPPPMPSPLLDRLLLTLAPPPPDSKVC